MRIGIFSFRAFDRRLARLAAPISSGGRICPPPSGARSAEYPSARRAFWPGWPRGTKKIIISDFDNKSYITELQNVHGSRVTGVH